MHLSRHDVGCVCVCERVSAVMCSPSCYCLGQMLLRYLWRLSLLWLQTSPWLHRPAPGNTKIKHSGQSFSNGRKQIQALDARSLGRCHGYDSFQHFTHLLDAVAFVFRQADGVTLGDAIGLFLSGRL